MNAITTTLKLDDAQEKRLTDALSEDAKPAILLFRILGPQLQSLFTEQIDLGDTPKLLLHGNPHLDNYARTYNGTGLVDFDRSRVGPSLWDITRALCSITFWSRDDQVRPHEEVMAIFFAAYQEAIEDRLAYWETPDFLRQISPKKFQMTPTRYLNSGKKWVKKMERNLVEAPEDFHHTLFEAYVNEHDPRLLEHWSLSEVAEVAGSMGKRHYVYQLDPKVETREPILLDIKETYIEEDNAYFHNPFKHQGVRMVTASRLYSPGIEEGIGYCSLHGEEYWVRRIPTFSAKVPVGLDHDCALQLARAIGLQLGRGHRIVDEIYTDRELKAALIASAQERRQEVSELCRDLNQAVLDLFSHYRDG